MTTLPALIAVPTSQSTTARSVLGWSVAALGVALAWPGGPLALLGAACAAAGAGWALRRPIAQGPDAAGTDDLIAQDVASSHRPDNAKEHEPGPQSAASTARSVIALAAARTGAEAMVATVVPVWSRQLEVTRDAASEGLSGILEQFSQMSTTLSSLVQDIGHYAVTAEPGAVDQAVRRESPALQALLAPSRRAFEQRDAALAELGRCVQLLNELQQVAKQTRDIARHTRLVAFNASIEANRDQRAEDGGAQAVSAELRNVATRMAEAGERVDQLVGQMLESTRRANREGGIHDTSPEELALELDLKAREALSALLGGLGTALQGSQSVQDASRALTEQLETIFVHFQFGDRISQMLSIVANDMNNFTDFVAANPRATGRDAAAWLAALEASYTMDEQRSTHHGNVHVEQGAGVEFF